MHLGSIGLAIGGMKFGGERGGGDEAISSCQHHTSSRSCMPFLNTGMLPNHNYVYVDQTSRPDIYIGRWLSCFQRKNRGRGEGKNGGGREVVGAGAGRDVLDIKLATTYIQTWTRMYTNALNSR